MEEVFVLLFSRVTFLPSDWTVPAFWGAGTFVLQSGFGWFSLLCGLCGVWGLQQRTAVSALFTAGQRLQGSPISPASSGSVPNFVDFDSSDYQLVIGSV